jgi:LysR family hydrogen peroxide-inducible transcriptional activator
MPTAQWVVSNTRYKIGFSCKPFEILDDHAETFAMEMHQIRYFRALEEELNFTRAAERCGISQPALTRAIRLLEEEFGGVLFHRERNETHLSELGRIVKPHLDQIFDQAALATQGAQKFTDLERAQLKLGVMCTVSPTDLVQLVAGVRVRHPGIRLEIVNADPAELDRALHQRDLEVAILSRPEASHDPNFHYQQLFHEQSMIVTSLNHRFADLKSVRASDIKQEPYLKRVNCEFAEMAGRVFNANGCIAETVYKSDRDDWILAMAAAGMGFSFMPQYSVNHPGVVATPLVEPEFWREVSLVTVRGRPHSPAVGALIHEAMHATWKNAPALAVEKLAEHHETFAGYEPDSTAS